MTIVLACDVPLVRNNGTAVAAVNLKTALEAKGHTVRVLCPDPEDAAAPGEYASSVLHFGPLDAYVRRNGVRIAGPSRKAVRRALEGADHLHIMTPFFLCGAAVREARRQGLSVTAGFHCQAENISNHLLLMNRRLVNLGIYRLLWRAVYSHVDAIHYPTQFIREDFENAIGRATPGQVISNGVGAEFAPVPGESRETPGSPFVVLSIGRYSREKSHDVLIRAAGRCRNRAVIRLILAGDGPRHAHIRRLCRRELAQPPVLGFMDRETLIRCIHSADLYVHPARVDLEAIACLEAIRGGLVPVIADSPRSATRNFALSGDNLFRSGDVASLAARLDDWIDHPERLAACRRAYEHYCDRFDRDRCMDDMERLILRTWEARREAAKDAAR